MEEGKQRKRPWNYTKDQSVRDRRLELLAALRATSRHRSKRRRDFLAAKKSGEGVERKKNKKAAKGLALLRGLRNQ